MADVKNKKVNLTWLVYSTYVILLGCSLGYITMDLFTPAKWLLIVLLLILDLFLVLGVIMMFLALKKSKDSHKITMSVNQKEQKKWSWALLLEVCIVYFLAQSPQGPQLVFLTFLVVSKVILTAAFLLIHFRLRKYIPTKIE